MIAAAFLGSNLPFEAPIAAPHVTPPYAPQPQKVAVYAPVHRGPPAPHRHLPKPSIL